MKYFLPPDIYKKFISGPPTGIAADPFAPEPSEEFKAGKRTPQSVFENAGISFPPGTNAGYDKSKGELFVTTTLEQLDLVEAYLSALDGGTMILGSDSRFHKDKTGSP